MAVLKSPFKEEGLNLYGLFQKISKGVFKPVPEPYSDQLRDLVTSMLSLNPSERPDINDVVAVARDMLHKLSTKEKERRHRSLSSEADNTPTEATDGADAHTSGSPARRDDATDDDRHRKGQRNESVEERHNRTRTSSRSSSRKGTDRDIETDAGDERRKDRNDNRVPPGDRTSAESSKRKAGVGSASYWQGFIVAKSVIEKLKILNYEERYCLAKSRFVVVLLSTNKLIDTNLYEEILADNGLPYTFMAIT